MWVNEVSCESSQPCFTSCFTHHKWTHDCNHTQDIAIQCGEETIEFNYYSMSCLISISLAFDVNRAHEMTSGSRAQCNIKCKLLVSESCTIFNLSDSISYNFVLLSLLTAVFPLAILIVCTTLALLAVLVVGFGVVVFIVVTRCCRRKCMPKNLRYKQLS